LSDLLKVTPGGVAMLDVSTEVKKYVEWLKRSGYRKGVREGIRRGEQRGLQKGIQTGVQQGMQQGMQQGLAPLLRLFSRRLDRALTASERDVVVARLDSLGADRLGDVVLDLPAPALAAWLADPDAQ
jgi:flagellar biosynthesis/type III secretory pathway protein FliH